MIYVVIFSAFLSESSVHVRHITHRLFLNAISYHTLVVPIYHDVIIVPLYQFRVDTTGERLQYYINMLAHFPHNLTHPAPLMTAAVGGRIAIYGIRTF